MEGAAKQGMGGGGVNVNFARTYICFHENGFFSTLY